jgi:hydrogenase nickel incorporation protein HypA/HybF
VHECSVVEQLVKIASVKAQEAHAAEVKNISLIVGELTGYMEESLLFYFKLLSKDTILEGSSLSVSYVKPKLRCPDCGKVFERERFSFDCPDCNIPGEMTKTGSEFYIDTMEVS